jgi:hypothetical protein
MSRNGNGTYNLPAGNPVVTGTTISSTWANNTLADMANAITGSIAADGQTPITGGLKGTNGTVAFAGVGQTKIPSGTTAQRAASPTDGMIRYNTDLKQYEGYKDGAWSIFGNGAGGTLFSDTVTATQGQTVIVLTTGYVLGGDNLSVYVNGSRQIYNVNYTETSTTSFTFTTGLNAGDLVNYTIGASTSLSVNAASVLYNEGATGAVDRNVESKLQESVSVLDFGAVGDGTTDDTVSLQEAINYSYLNNVNLYIPRGTYKLSNYLIWNGSNMYGDGEGNTIINGADDCDVFFSPDYSIGQTGSVSSFRQNAHVSDMTITVNSSGLQTYPNATFTRPVYPIVGTWSASLSVSNGDYYKSSTGKVYKCVASGTTSSTEPSFTVGEATDGTVTWLYIDSQQRYVGNAGFAIPFYNGNVPSDLFPDHWVFKNIRIEASGSPTNLATSCIYSQYPFYDCTFENNVWRYTKYGFLNAPPTTNFKTYEYSPDSCIFIKIELFCNIPFISFNAVYSTMINVQCYASNVGDKSISLLGFQSQTRTNTQGWNLENYYCEPNSATTGLLGIIDGNSHIINGGTLKASYGSSYYVFSGNGSTIQSNTIGNDGTNPILYIYGNYNTFTATHSAVDSLSNLVVDNGLGNAYYFTYTDSYLVESERQLTALTGTIRNAYGVRQNDWLVKNCATTPFYDMLLGAREFLIYGNSTNINVSDSTLETGGYVRFQNGKGFSSPTANRQPIAIGSRIPAGKVQILLKGRMSLSTTAYISLIAIPPSGSNVTLNNINPTWNTNWQVFEIDQDLSAYAGYTLQIAISDPASTATYLDFAWVAIVPFSPANTIVKNQFFSGIIDCEGTGTPEGSVTANAGSTYRNISGGAGTSFYVKESGAGNTGWVAK